MVYESFNSPKSIELCFSTCWRREQQKCNKSPNLLKHTCVHLGLSLEFGSINLLLHQWGHLHFVNHVMQMFWIHLFSRKAQKLCPDAGVVSLHHIWSKQVHPVLRTSSGWVLLGTTFPRSPHVTDRWWRRAAGGTSAHGRLHGLWRSRGTRTSKGCDPLISTQLMFSRCLQ